jgi:hypothetical protein
MTNIYWPVYKNLEKELVELSNQVHIDDKQLDIYSVKIIELLLRCSVEIESISKCLYFSLGGVMPSDRDLYFDTDCMQLLEDKWQLSKKQVIASSLNFHFLREENKILTPLKKAHKRGTSGSEWKKAYQAVKHDRANNLENGNLKNLIRAMAALYILNLYYKDDKFELEKNEKTIPSNMGSDIFNIKIHQYSGYDGNHNYIKKEDFIECVYLTKQTDESEEIWKNAIKNMNDGNLEFFRKHPKFIEAISTDPKLLENYKGTNLMWDILGQSEYMRMVGGAQHFLQEANSKTKNEAILNKNQIY